jgi:rhamnogalacturonyl hydrolase YesR
MRAIVKSLEWMSAFLDRNSPESLDLLKILRDLTSAILRYQQPSGIWHQLMDDSDSYPETSGTGFIVSTLQAACLNGWIDTVPATARGAKALEGFVTLEGTVRNGCLGTPPLATRGDYRRLGPADDDPHATGGVLMALAGVKNPGAGPEALRI